MRTPDSIDVEIGGTQIRIETGDAPFRDMLHHRYGDFIGGECNNPIALRVHIAPGAGYGAERRGARPDEAEPGAGTGDLSVRNDSGLWTIERGDFHATYDARRRQASVRQSANPWSIDALIRIIHSLELAGRRGFLIHAASAIRHGRAFIFAGPSGAGKSTISRLAPASVALLTDEISYVRGCDDRFLAWGTPFAGELGKPGENVSAPIAALYFLGHAAENRIVRLPGAEAVRSLLKNILFFAKDAELVKMVFENAVAFLERTDVFRMEFVPDDRIWNMIE